MAMTILEPFVWITGGVDTHLHLHAAAAVDANGGFLGTETFPVGRRHYRDLQRWLEGFGPIDKVGVEGTGSYGAGLAQLRADGIAVVEVDRPNHQVRNRQGKSDHTDAVAAARARAVGSRPRPAQASGRQRRGGPSAPDRPTLSGRRTNPEPEPDAQHLLLR